MFRSISGASLDAEALIRDYDTFQRGELVAITDTSNGPKMVAEWRALRSKAASFAERAQVILSAPTFASIDPLLQEDVRTVAEEAPLAIAELDEDADPEKKWQKMSAQQKLDATQRMPVDGPRVDTVRARLQGKLRGQKPSVKGDKA